ncbi:MAG TPA: phosphoethanolamine transferase, partial [Ottowia sp.]|nr:phosphoethanolamine transferase [Ottowia sp.]
MTHRAPLHAARRGLRPLTVMVLAALWVASIGNLALWRGLAALPELGNTRGLLFGLAFALMIGA